MSVQKITSLTQQKKSLKPNNTAKSSFLNSISFKGYSKQVTMHNGSKPHTYGTSGSLYPGNKATVGPYDIEHSEDTSVKKGEKGYVYQDYDRATVDVYYADLGEKVTNRIRSNHAYIVEYDKMPEPVTEEQIKSSTKTSELKGFVESLEKRKAIIKVGIEQTEDEIKSAQNYLEAAKKAYDTASQKYSEKVQQKIEQEVELEETVQRLESAKAKYAQVKEVEKAAYIAAQTAEILKEARGKLNELKNNDSGLAALMAQIDKFLGSKG